MNKNKLIIGVAIGVIFLSVALYLIINASNLHKKSPEVVLECDNNNVVSNTTIACKIKAKNFNYGVSAISTKIVLGENLNSPEYSFAIPEWQGAVEDGIIDLYTDNNKTGDFDIASFTLKTNDINQEYNTNISLQNTLIYNDKFEEVRMDSTSIKISINK